MRGSAHKGTAGQGFRAGREMKEEITALGGFFCGVKLQHTGIIEFSNLQIIESFDSVC
jgi:hypothetical protein